MKEYSIIDILKKAIIILPLSYVIGLLVMFLIRSWRFLLWRDFFIKRLRLKENI